MNAWRLITSSVLFFLPLFVLPTGCKRSVTPSADGDLVENTKEPSPSPAYSPESAGADDYFIDVTDSTGIDFKYMNGRDAGQFAILESLGGGVGVADADNDGLMDLCFAGGGSLHNEMISGSSCGFFRNLGEFQFRSITESAGLQSNQMFTHGVFPADYDADGFADLAITGYGGIQIYRNQGDGTFAQMELGKAAEQVAWSSSASWGDYNNDGHLDLYIAQYVNWSWDEHPLCFDATGQRREVCAPSDFRGLDDVMLFSSGSGKFSDETKKAGLVPGGKGLGVISVDIDDDGDTDIYVANDTTDNFLYMNLGNGTFDEQALIAGVSGDDVGVNTGSMGIAVGDSDEDGLVDIWVTNFERELFALYRNEGSGVFTHVSRRSGLTDLGGLFVGFGTAFLDVDHDLDQDLVVANGHVSYHSKYAAYEQQPLLLRNLGKGRFERVAEGGYFNTRHVGRGLVSADLNNDGIWDLVFCNSESGPAVLKGRVPRKEGWISVQLIGRRVNRNAIGATIKVDVGDNVLKIASFGGGSYLSQSDPRFLLPVSGHQMTATVRWSAQHQETFVISEKQRHQQWIESLHTGR